MNILQGQALAFFAFDVGYEIALEKLGTLLPSSPAQPISRRKQTPAYLQYARPPHLFTVGVADPLNGIPGQVHATIFDFGVVSIAFRWPIATTEGGFPLASMPALGNNLAGRDLEGIARGHVETLMKRMEPVIIDPKLSALVEDYYLFIFEKFERSISAQELLDDHGPTLAQMLSFEVEPLSKQQQAEAISERLSYYERDLVVIGWNAAMIYDQEYEDAANVLELLNIELLEARYMDAQLDIRIEEYARLVREHRFFWPIPFRAPHRKLIEAISELRIESSVLSERVDNALKLIGDLYLGRLHAAAARRCYLLEWETIISRKLDVIEDYYELLTDRVQALQGQTLELIIIILILFEIVMALF